MLILWRTTYDPLPDITAWEVAIDRACINQSGIVGVSDCKRMGTALRHRIAQDGRRMDAVWTEYQASH